MRSEDAFPVMRSEDAFPEMRDVSSV